jgi:TolB-like protein/Tfp pilus assembly protein PilF
VLDEITLSITVQLQVELTEGEKARPVTTDNFDAWRYVEKGKQFMFASGDTKKAREFYEKALEIDPEYAGALTAIAWTHLWDARYGKSHSRGESFKRAVELAKKSVAMDDNQPSVHGLFIFIYLYQKQYDKAIEEGRKAIALDPNNSDLRIWFGEALYRSGNFEEAVKMCEEAMRLHPYAPLWYFGHMMNAYYWVERYEESLSTAEQLIDLGKARNPKIVWWGYWGTARAKVRLGRVSEAQEDVNKLLELRPEYCLELDRRNTLYKPEIIAKEHEDMRKAGLREHPPLPLPDKPSIAVLAFDNLSDDPKQEYFSDGLSEEIISALSKTDQLFVIARNSSFTYKGKPINVKQISRELGVRYVLEGSVRKSEDRVRITAQLIDATKGHHLWSERYDRDLKDIFAVQDEITMKIITALQVELTDGEQMRIWAKRFKRLDVLLKAMELVSVSRKGTEESVIRWGQVAEEVVDMAPESPLGYRHLGWYHFMLGSWGKSPRENFKKAYGFALKAISLDEYDGMSHGLLGNVYLKMRQHEQAIAAGKRAIELFPNGADVHMFLGYTLNYAGRPDEALEYLNKAIRLNPFPPYYIPRSIGHSYLLKGQYEKALPEFKKALHLHLAPESPEIPIWLAVNYILLGREEEARASAKKALQLAPFLSVSWRAKTAPYKNQAYLKLEADAMRKAGFPEGS